MRKVKVIQIEDRGEITVKEISPYGLYQAYQMKDKSLEQLQALVNDAISPGFAEIKTWYPSEQQLIIDAVLAVNDSFFAIARKLKVDGLITEMAKTLQNSLPPLYAELFKKGMEEKLGTTVGQYLSLPSKNLESDQSGNDHVQEANKELKTSKNEIVDHGRQTGTHPLTHHHPVSTSC